MFVKNYSRQRERARRIEALIEQNIPPHPIMKKIVMLSTRNDGGVKIVQRRIRFYSLSHTIRGSFSTCGATSPGPSPLDHLTIAKCGQKRPMVDAPWERMLLDLDGEQFPPGAAVDPTIAGPRAP
jgi:hypothetical protein